MIRIPNVKVVKVELPRDEGPIPIAKVFQKQPRDDVEVPETRPTAAPVGRVILLRRQRSDKGRRDATIPSGTDGPRSASSVIRAATRELREEEEEAGNGRLLGGAAGHLPESIAQRGDVGRAGRSEIVENVGNADPGVEVGGGEAGCHSATTSARRRVSGTAVSIHFASPPFLSSYRLKNCLVGPFFWFFWRRFLCVLGACKKWVSSQPELTNESNRYRQSVLSLSSSPSTSRSPTGT
mmetsp:Transcript_8122/g.16962  ORF Transcript_8122/g.16962 Transcript_8122/m.16962 type:complete len:238 (-) Transcript_8122:179-892(-)